LEELVAGLLRPRLFPFGKLSKAKSAAHVHIVEDAEGAIKATIGPLEKDKPQVKSKEKKNNRTKHITLAEMAS